MKTPSFTNAVLRATNASLSELAILPKFCFTAASFRTVARLLMVKSDGRLVDNDSWNNPFSKTSKVTSSPANNNCTISDGLSLLSGVAWCCLFSLSAISFTLVYFHSSLLVLGKPLFWNDSIASERVSANASDLRSNESKPLMMLSDVLTLRLLYCSYNYASTSSLIQSYPFSSSSKANSFVPDFTIRPLYNTCTKSGTI